MEDAEDADVAVADTCGFVEAAQEGLRRRPLEANDLKGHGGTQAVVGRELGITLLRFLVIRYGVIPASRGGKLKTLTQGVAVGMYVLALTGPLATLRFWVMAAAVVLTVATGLDYVRQAIVLRRRGIAERRAALKETEG
ncbi:hypothetical protein SFUMM280S_11020 [Streptomyces fumanus]